MPVRRIVVTVRLGGIEGDFVNKRSIGGGTRDGRAAVIRSGDAGNQRYTLRSGSAELNGNRMGAALLRKACRCRRGESNGTVVRQDGDSVPG